MIRRGTCAADRAFLAFDAFPVSSSPRGKAAPPRPCAQMKL